MEDIEIEQRKGKLLRKPKYDRALDSLEINMQKIIKRIYMNEYQNEQFDELIIALNSIDVDQQHIGCIGIRKILSNTNTKYLRTQIDANCICKFIKFIKQSKHSVLQLEAAQLLTNIAETTESTKLIIIYHFHLYSCSIILNIPIFYKDNGAILLLCQLIESPYLDIQSQAIQSIASISEKRSEYRDLILQCGGVKILVNTLLTSSDQQIFTCGQKALCNFCLCKPPPDRNLVQIVMYPLTKALQEQTDLKLLRDIAHAIHFLSNGDEANIQLLVNSGVIPALIRHLNHFSSSIIIPCLSSIGNICQGSDEQRDNVINCGALPQIFKSAKHQNEKVRECSFWVLSNIAGKSTSQICLILQQKKYIDILFTCILNDSDKISIQATWVIYNCTSQEKPEDIKRLMDMKIVDVFTEMLKTEKDIKTIELILKSLNHILQCGEKHFKLGQENPFISELKALGFIEMIKKLLNHSNKIIQKSSLFLFENFCNFDDKHEITIN